MTSFPTEEVSIPTQGLIYPKTHPFSSGKVKMKYMTAKEEDILSNENYMDKGIVLDKLLESLLVTDEKVDVASIFPGDKMALLVAARVLGYGKMYEFNYKNESYKVDLTQLKEQILDPLIINEYGEVKYDFYDTDNTVTFKFLNEKDLKLIEEEIKGITKALGTTPPTVTTRLKYQVQSINGSRDKNEIKTLSENILARDSRELRDYMNKIEPQVFLTFEDKEGKERDLPFGAVGFFYPHLLKMA